ncbi:MAG: WG repeat-containing protein [Flavobacteriaceae bacterium]|nr:WG repeat-containing protein [Flavobacteriaceae bacterium]MDG1941209.1 WG repeat-containing protein [Flavobacteriaceae bacterium]
MDALLFKDGLAKVKAKGSRWNNPKIGFIDKNGNEVIPPVYTRVKSFNQGLVAVKNNENNWGL